MARYDSMRKIERNRLLVEYREKLPDLSLKEIGLMVNPPITPQRVWAILKKAREKRNGEGSQSERRNHKGLRSQ